VRLALHRPAGNDAPRRILVVEDQPDSRRIIRWHKADMAIALNDVRFRG
jgi:hypothetical protein